MISNLIANSFKDTVILKLINTTNEYNESTYDSTFLDCRIQRKDILVTTAANETILCKTYIYSSYNIPANSLIEILLKDYTVIQTDEIKDIDNNVLYYKSYLR